MSVRKVVAGEYVTEFVVILYGGARTIKFNGCNVVDSMHEVP